MNRTGLVTDERMILHSSPEDGHPDSPERLSQTLRMLKETLLWHLCVVLPSREASKEEVCLAHTEDHFEDVCSLEEIPFDHSSYFSVLVASHLLAFSSERHCLEPVHLSSCSSSGWMWCRAGRAIVQRRYASALASLSEAFTNLSFIQQKSTTALQSYGHQAIIQVCSDVSHHS